MHDSDVILISVQRLSDPYLPTTTTTTPNIKYKANTSAMPGPRIAIIGAGPSGLTLARILTVQNEMSTSPCSVTVYERDESASARTQGGTLDLHPRTGQAALRAAHLIDQFKAHARYEGQDLTLADRTGKVWAAVRDTDTGRPEIDRTVLRQMLLDSLPAGCVRWGAHFLGADVDESGKGRLRFADGRDEGVFDLVVGGDGAWSKIRPLLTPVQPFYSGISGVELRIRDVDAKHPEVSKLIGNGSYFAFGEEEGQCLLCQRNGDGSVKVYAMGWQPENWVKDCGIDFANADTAREALVEQYKTWSPEQRELIRSCDDDIIPRAAYMLPVGLRWASKKGVTLIGDSAHLMTPFAGEGVNCAMADAMKLAESIARHPQDMGRAVAEYEQWMFRAAKKATQDTWESLLDRFQRGGTEKFARKINILMLLLRIVKPFLIVRRWASPRPKGGRSSKGDE